MHDYINEICITNGLENLFALELFRILTKRMPFNGKIIPMQVSNSSDLLLTHRKQEYILGANMNPNPCFMQKCDKIIARTKL